MYKKLLMAGLVPACALMGDPSLYSEVGANLFAGSTYLRYGAMSSDEHFTTDAAFTFSSGLVTAGSINFGVYANAGKWKIGPEFSAGLGKFLDRKFWYQSYCARAIYDLEGPWRATISMGVQPLDWKRVYPELEPNPRIYPVYSLGLQKVF